ncbi:rho GTPase-activating protein 3-like [Phoenix dactylifera]|uniref:Rho GTPase-activating protein 3-like n=1 Tax=Phoenix dactylifera TaxID=42345 RepID=A0A8B7BKS8_PHODC|nr:rho GTPase-activating protein 3-like [Phoenix dactylifera]
MARFHLHLGFQHSPPLSLPSRTSEEEEDEGECPVSSPLMVAGGGQREGHGGGGGGGGGGHQFSIVAAVAAALRKSLVMCSVGAVPEDRGCPSSMEIGWPTDVRHISHVTFDRFGGFLGLPVEFEPEVPESVPSASVSVFGVSAKSMQCSYDTRGNSVPTILLLMQRALYSQGGLQAEGIFRINAENSQEAYVRDQLNRGIVPPGTDFHCLAGLIKAWFRELPTGVLDSLTPDQVMHCNTEEECSLLARTLPPTEAALLDWAINLMADVVEHEHSNKMNARNIAMVFAPNMTQMADPLTALIHAVQVMNFLKTLIIKTLQEREEASAVTRIFHPYSDSPSDKYEPNLTKSTEKSIVGSNEKTMGMCLLDRTAFRKFLFSAEHAPDSDVEESFRSFEKKSDISEDREFISGKSSPIGSELNATKDGSKSGRCHGDVEGLLDRLNFRKGVRKLCRHPVFQLNRSSKKLGQLGIGNSREGREAWA